MVNIKLDLLESSMARNNPLYVKRPRSVDLLDRMLNHTSLTTKRVAHNHILDIGSNFIQKSTIDIESIQQQAAKEAQDAAEWRHVRELRAALQRQQKHMEDDKNRCLENQKMFYDDLAKRVAQQRQRAEEERIKQVTRKLEKERDIALENQWKEAEQLQEEAVELAIGSLRQNMRDEYALEREKAVAEALALAREKFKEREKKTVMRVREECAKEASHKAELASKKHEERIAELQNMMRSVQRNALIEVNQRKALEREYTGLEEDYKRFLDYTDGKYHSDYLMQLRFCGSRNRISSANSEKDSTQICYKPDEKDILLQL